MDDIDKVLGYQIKKEIADRYFSFRKTIEQDSNAYLDAVFEATALYEAGIGLNLIRIYILLQDHELIRQFQDCTGLERDLFYDPYICSSATIRQRLFIGWRTRGFTRRSRFKNLFFDIYLKLLETVTQYRSTYLELVAEHETISEEIKIFYRKNNLQSILSFIRSLDHHANHDTLLHSDRPSNGSEAALESKMQLSPPQAAELLLPAPPIVAPLTTAKKTLLQLAATAARNQASLDARTFCVAGASSSF